MAQAFKCGRCKQYFDGEPKGEISSSVRKFGGPMFDLNVVLCVDCYKHIRKELTTASLKIGE